MVSRLTADCQTCRSVFQSFALFPWLTGLDNVDAPLKARGIGPIDRRKQALKMKADRQLSDDFFYGVLEEHFSEDEAHRQLNTAIHWGRYAEILDYDADAGKLFLPET